MRRGRTASFTGRLGLNISFSAGCGRKRTRQNVVINGRWFGRNCCDPTGAGPARWAFGPPPERAARTRQNWGGELGRAFATRRVAQFAATPRGGVQLVGARCTHRCGELPTRDEWVVLLRLVESRGPKPPAAEARNSRCRGPRRLRPLELRASTRRGRTLQKGAVMEHCFCGSDAREEQQLSTRKRRVAGRPWAGVRPARFCEPQ